MSNRNPKLNSYFDKAKKWQEEFSALRVIALDCQLDEEMKWGKPCYTFQNNNIIVLQGFKDFCALLFIKGSLLKDPKGILEKPGESTQAGRRIPFTSIEEVVDMESTLQAYISEAIEIEKAGLKVKFNKHPEAIPAELQIKMDETPELKMAFYSLTPGRQRAYILHFSKAKQSKTRVARIEKCMQRILDGKGLND